MSDGSGATYKGKAKMQDQMLIGDLGLPECGYAISFGPTCFWRCKSLFADAPPVLAVR